MRSKAVLAIIMLVCVSLVAASSSVKERRQMTPNGPPSPGVLQTIKEFKKWAQCMTDCIVSIVEQGARMGGPSQYEYWRDNWKNIYNRCVLPPGPCGDPPNGGWNGFMGHRGIRIEKAAGHIVKQYEAVIQRGWEEHGPKFGVMLFLAIAFWVVFKVPFPVIARALLAV